MTGYGMGFADELRAPPDEAEDTNASHLGQISVLLNAAVELGRALEHYSMSQNSRVEDAIRRMAELNPGRGASEEGEAVLRIIKAYVDEGSIDPTAKKLLTFLGVKKLPPSDGEPLPVNHPLWGETLKSVSWRSFKTLVQSAKRRL